MPVQNARISLAAGQWGELTNGDVSREIVFQNVGGYAGKVQATPDAVAPDEGEGAFSYAPGAGDRATWAAWSDEMHAQYRYPGNADMAKALRELSA